MDGRIVITGDSSGVVSAMQRASEAIRGFQTQADSSFGKMQASVGALQAKWVAMGSFVIGGAGFKEAIDTTVDLHKEATALGKALGIDATQASILNVALGDIYQTKDTLIAANGALTRTLKQNEEAFENLGVKTRDQNGEFRSSLDIMLEVNNRLMQFKEGTDRNIEGMKIYGKQWGEVSGLLKLNTELMEASRAKAAELNLAVGEESLESTTKYRAAMNDVGDVLTAVKNVIGQAVMPVLTDLGNEFSETGPEKVGVMQKSIAVLVAAFYGLKNGVEIVWLSFKAIVQSITVALLTVGEVGSRALEFDFSGAKAAFDSGWEQIKEINRQGGADIVAASEKNGAAIRRALDQGFNPRSTPINKPAGGSEGSSGGEKKEKDDSRLRQWDAELAELKLRAQEKALAEGHFFEMSKEAERKFWSDKLALTDAGTKEQAALRKKMADLGLAILKEQYDAEQEKLKTQMEVAKDDYAKREALAVKFAENAKQRYGADSKEYQAALKQQETMRREHEDKMRQIDMIRLDSLRRNSEQVVTENERNALAEYELGLITRGQLLELQRGFILEKMNLDLQAADYELGLLQAGTVEYEQALAKRQEIKRRYEGRLSDNSREKTVEGRKPETNIANSMQSSIEQGFTSMLMRARTFQQAMAGITRSVGQTMIQEMVTKPFAQWVAGWARKLAMNMGFLTAEQGQEASAAITGSLTKKATSLGEIMANAGVAASGAYAATAAIPYVGPVLAPAAAATAFAGASAYSAALFSASGGFDIPKGMNPMTQLHEEEMVLPKHIANPMRDLLAGNEGAAAASAPVINYHDYRGDLTPSQIRRNVKTIADALRDYSKKQ